MRKERSSDSPESHSGGSHGTGIREGKFCSETRNMEQKKKIGGSASPPS